MLGGEKPSADEQQVQWSSVDRLTSGFRRGDFENVLLPQSRVRA